MKTPNIPPTGGPRVGIQLSWVSESILEISLHGRMTAEDIEVGMKQIRALTMQAPLTGVLIDGSAVEGYSSDTAQTAERLVALLRGRGARELVFVMRSSAARMITASVAFASRLPVKIYETRAEALAHLGAL